MEDQLNSDEFDAIMDLIITVLFMAFGILATAFMCYYLSRRVEASTETDKVVYTYENYQQANTYSFTGYQAYMMAWCMDELSYVPLYYIGGEHNLIMSGSDLSSVNTDDENSDKWLRLCTLDDSGNVRPQFIPYRNRLIVGTGDLANTSVKALINMAAGVDAKAHYRGTNKIRYKLSLTDKYKTVNNLGTNPNTGGKTFQWILKPELVS